MGYSFVLERKKMKRMGLPLVILALVALAFAFPMVNIKFRGLGVLKTDSSQTVAFFESHVRFDWKPEHAGASDYGGAHVCGGISGWGHEEDGDSSFAHMEDVSFKGPLS